MKDSEFLHETIRRFGDGLAAAMDAGTDTFSFEFDPNEWPEDKPLMIAASGAVDKTMTLVVLIRPKMQADPMLEVMQQAREEMLAQLATAGKRTPKDELPSLQLAGRLGLNTTKLPPAPVHDGEEQP